MYDKTPFVTRSRSWQGHLWHPQLCSSAGRRIAASRSVYKTTDESFRFHNQNFDEMRCKLDSTENPRSIEKYPTHLNGTHQVAGLKPRFPVPVLKNELNINKISIWYVGLLGNNLTHCKLMAHINLGNGVDTPLPSKCHYKKNKISIKYHHFWTFGATIWSVANWRYTST